MYLEIILNSSHKQLSRVMQQILLTSILYPINCHFTLFEGLFSWDNNIEWNLSILTCLQSIFQYYNPVTLHKNIQLMILSNIIGIFLLIISSDIFMVFLALELMNFSQYIQIGHYISGIKYFLLSSIVSTFFLLGITLIYSQTGHQNREIQEQQLQQKSNQGISLLAITIFFKLGVVPFHQWSPDLYVQIELDLMIYIQIIIKYGIFILQYNFSILFQPILDSLFIPQGIQTMILGSQLLNSQFHIQRFLALSSITHQGFIILQYSYSYQLYIYIYSITSLLLFNILGDLAEYPNIILKVLFTLLLFSLSGLPPFPGFYTKFYLLIDIYHQGLNSILILLFISSVILSANYISLGLISFQLGSTRFIFEYPRANGLAVLFVLLMILPLLGI